jgi:alpha-L-arabinofuranosidase
MLSVINRDPANDVSAEIRIANSLRRQDATVEELNSDAIDATNSFATPDRVSVSAGTIEKFGDGASYTFPAHSLTVFTMSCVPE